MDALGELVAELLDDAFRPKRAPTSVEEWEDHDWAKLRNFRCTVMLWQRVAKSTKELFWPWLALLHEREQPDQLLFERPRHQAGVEVIETIGPTGSTRVVSSVRGFPRRRNKNKKGS